MSVTVVKPNSQQQLFLHLLYLDLEITIVFGSSSIGRVASD